MASISKISIDGFKAFPESFTLELGGKNLLMYGENGSGKSSIYYALHALLQSQCKDKNSIYFNPTHQESIVNQNTKKPNAKVEILFEGSDVVYSISHEGYKESVVQTTSPLRDLNGQCVFINHKFLFNFFSFRNSQYIDLFPVFIKDILPFVLTQDGSEYISTIYDDVMKGIKRHGRSNKIEDSFRKRIDKFNSETKYVIEQINTNAVETATDVFNKYFRNDDDRKLIITLSYDNNNDKVPQPNKSYWLRYGHRYQYVEKAGIREEKDTSRGMEILQPSITLKIEELQDDGATYRLIEKPQTYFNEAKLTAIALSIRFALLDTVSSENGRFLALDDMLISLDMSNRMKVIYYLLNNTLKAYKLYVFTHDRLFYHTFKRIIETQYDNSKWVFGGVYLNDLRNPISPEFNPETKTKIDDIHDAYSRHDYFRCGTLLRQLCERCLKELLPDSLRTEEDSTTKNLDKQILSLEDFCKHEGIDFTPFKNLKSYKDLFLNSTAHNDITSPFYRNEIKACMKALEELNKINRSKAIECNKDLSFQITIPGGSIHTIRLRLREEKLLLLEYGLIKRISYYSKCEVLKEISEAGETQINEGFESLYEAYKTICERHGVAASNDLLDILKDRKGLLQDRL